MSDTEDFLLGIDPDEFAPDEAPSKPRKRKHSRSKKKKKKEKMKIPRLTPNHFIGFRIHDAVIRQRIGDVQNRIIEKNPLLNKALIDLRTLHVTLAVTRLENEEKMKELRDRLEDWSGSGMKLHFVQPIRLTFRGIGTFRKDVAFVKIDECENYKRLCGLSEAVKELLLEGGFSADDKRKFHPHLTLLKLSKSYELFKQKKSVAEDIEVLSKCDDEFGSQDVRDIQLLSMTAKKDEDGYYKCLWEVRTRQDDSEESDMTERSSNETNAEG